MSRRQRHLLGGVFVVACVLAACHVLWLPQYVIDDAYISFRYARNLIDGQGLVFNPGERVEGFSNFSWVMLTAVGMAFDLEPAAWARSLGCAAILGTILISAYTTRRLVGKPSAALATAAILCASTALCTSYLNGLETGLYGLLVTSIVAAAIFGRWKTASLLIGLAAITRPEGVGILIIAGVVAALIRGGPRGRRAMAALFLPAVAIVGILLTFRIGYYGHLLPNSVQAKSVLLPLLSQSDFGQWFGLIFNSQGVEYASGFLRDTFGLFAVLAFVPLFRCIEQRWAVVFSLAIVAMGLAVAVYNFGDWMTSYRLLTPYLPTLAVLVVWGLWESAEWLAYQTGVRSNPLVPVVGACIIVVCAYGQFQRHRPLIRTNPDPCLAAMLANSRQPDLLAATDVLGRIGYYAPGVRFLDMAGLTDEYIARHGNLSPTFGRKDFDYVLSRKPQFIMNNIYEPWPERLNRREFTDGYWWVVHEPLSMGDPDRPWPRFVFVKRGTTLEGEFRRLMPGARFLPPKALLNWRSQVCFKRVRSGLAS